MNILQEATYDQDHIQFDNNREYRIKNLSQNAIQAINSIIGQLSDGYWENSTAMEYYWPYIDTDNTDVIIKGCNNYYDRHNKYCRFADMNEQHIKEWLANKIKFIVKYELEDYPNKGKWERNNDSELDYIDGTVSQAYAAYDELKGRNSKTYGSSYDVPAFQVIDITVKKVFNSNDADAVKEIARIAINNGHQVEIKNNKTGQKVKLG